jgi:hypothetical protein
MVNADTMANFMNIANNIPKMEMKADEQSQAWARSARNILILTTDSISESLTLANETAAAKGEPMFCLPSGTSLDASKLNDLVQQTYRNISSQQSDKDKLTVSQVALMGLSKQYPCQKNGSSASSHPLRQNQGNQNSFDNAPVPMQHNER